MHVSSRARRYARALARVASEKNIEERVLEELQGLVAYFDEHPVARLTLESPATSAVRRDQLLKALESAHDFAPATTNLLRLLAEGRRSQLLPEVAAGLREHLQKRSGVLSAHVTTAAPLDESQLSELREAIEKMAGGRKVQLEVEEDPSLIAGAVTRIGSVVHDGSLAHQLGRLRHELVAE